MTATTQPTNRRNRKCSMLDGEIDTIVGAIHLMLEPSDSAGVDSAVIVQQFLSHSLNGFEQNQFWAELKAGHSEKWPKESAQSVAS
jgi:hypothetical protein